jgi:hypothetical protein
LVRKIHREAVIASFEDPAGLDTVRAVLER